MHTWHTQYIHGTPLLEHKECKVVERQLGTPSAETRIVATLVHHITIANSNIVYIHSNTHAAHTLSLTIYRKTYARELFTGAVTRKTFEQEKKKITLTYTHTQSALARTNI
jgi:hypothetical protein